MNSNLHCRSQAMYIIVGSFSVWKFRRSLLWSCLLHLLHIRSLSFAEQDSYFDRNLRKWVLFHIKMFSNRPHLWNVSWYTFVCKEVLVQRLTRCRIRRMTTANAPSSEAGKMTNAPEKWPNAPYSEAGKIRSIHIFHWTTHGMRPVPSLPFFLLFGIMALKWSGARRRERLYYFPWIAREISSSGSGSRPQTWNHSWNLSLRHAININEDLLQIIPYDSIFS